MEGCFVCDRIEEIRAGANDTFVAELDTGYAVIGYHQFFRGYTLFLSKVHCTELHLLEPGFRDRFLRDFALVAEAVFRAFRPRKLNYELLGNKEPHLHWHFFPRHDGDPCPEAPVWAVDKEIREAESTRPDAAALAELKARLLAELETLRRR